MKQGRFAKMVSKSICESGACVTKLWSLSSVPRISMIDFTFTLSLIEISVPSLVFAPSDCDRMNERRVRCVLCLESSSAKHVVIEGHRG